MCVNLDQNDGGRAVTEFSFQITPGTVNQGRYDILMEIKSNGRVSKTYLSMPLLAAVPGSGMP